MKIIQLGLVAATLGLVACEQTPDAGSKMERQVDKANENLRLAKEDAAQEIRTLHEKLNVRLAQVEERLDHPGLTEERKVGLEAERKEIKARIKRLDDSLADVESSTDDTWDNVKAGVANTAKDVGNWFDRQAELIDQQTKADGDDDGH